MAPIDNVAILGDAATDSSITGWLMGTGLTVAGVVATLIVRGIAVGRWQGTVETKIEQLQQELAVVKAGRDQDKLMLLAAVQQVQTTVTQVAEAMAEHKGQMAQFCERLEACFTRLDRFEDRMERAQQRQGGGGGGA